MAASEKRGLLSIGIFLIILVVSIILYSPLQVIPHWSLILPLIIALYGCWLMVLAGMRSSSSQKYERGPFSTFAWGLLLIAMGGAWFLFTYGLLYSLAIILLVLGALAIATALKRK